MCESGNISYMPVKTYVGDDSFSSCRNKGKLRLKVKKSEAENAIAGRSRPVLCGREAASMVKAWIYQQRFRKARDISHRVSGIQALKNSVIHPSCTCKHEVLVDNPIFPAARH
ncbi:hypothetical protein AV530_019517 [Patagioenas fasciata monilis]|uniref:Uncharacterized protein n=1 Tax=Patagioenas fasciata monilis TaxID=372326 RepID=A0A1V4JE32_PATFA|nr:hypothetical protein AV530_019517 [Patagioenas fasciata monilis]